MDFSRLECDAASPADGAQAERRLIWQRGAASVTANDYAGTDELDTYEAISISWRGKSPSDFLLQQFKELGRFDTFDLRPVESRQCWLPLFCRGDSHVDPTGTRLADSDTGQTYKFCVV